MTENYNSIYKGWWLFTVASVNTTFINTQNGHVSILCREGTGDFDGVKFLN